MLLLNIHKNDIVLTAIATEMNDSIYWKFLLKNIYQMAYGKFQWVQWKKDSVFCHFQ